MRPLNYALKQLGVRHRDGSAVTQVDRAYLLSVIADQLHDLGYKQLQAQELKGRHVNALRRLWQTQELAPGTVNKRLEALRWWAEKVGRLGVLQRGETPDGVLQRPSGPPVSPARELEPDKLAALRDPYVRLSVELQRAFGLRRDEALKIRPCQADKGDRLVVQGSWTKGGRSRAVPIRTAAQRDVLERAKTLAGAGALINRGKPPALPGDSQSLTVPGVCCSSSV